MMMKSSILKTQAFLYNKKKQKSVCKIKKIITIFHRIFEKEAASISLKNPKNKNKKMFLIKVYLL